MFIRLYYGSRLKRNNELSSENIQMIFCTGIILFKTVENCIVYAHTYTILKSRNNIMFLL